MELRVEREMKCNPRQGGEPTIVVIIMNSRFNLQEHTDLDKLVDGSFCSIQFNSILILTFSGRSHVWDSSMLLLSH